VVCGSLLGAAIGTVLSVLVGFGPGVALLGALTAMIMLPRKADISGVSRHVSNVPTPEVGLLSVTLWQATHSGDQRIALE
jgi:hypothetical protein